MGEGGGGGMNWAIVIDMYTLMCIKWITNKNLQYKKINKIKFKTSKKKKCCVFCLYPTWNRKFKQGAQN